MDLESNLEAVGKRLPYLAKYKASVDKDKKLTGVNIKIFCDSGANYNESTADIAVGFAKSVYIRFMITTLRMAQLYSSSPVWRLSPMAVLTDTPSNTYCRAPGSTQVGAQNLSQI